MSGRLQSGLIAGLWLSWVVYWVLAARGVKPVSRRESPASRLAYLTPLVIGALIMALASVRSSWLGARFLPPAMMIYGSGIAVMLAGLVVTVWARRHLGTNWSGTITIKRGHDLVRTGPYRFVRHPIYSGVILAIIGTAVALGEWLGFVGAALIVGSFLVKLWLEERILAEVFGDDHVRYRAEVPALVPRFFGSRARCR